ncbi:MAG: DUF2130 domain-containing protein [Verrucomicrobia bacterium]|nr:DUF2130 domain-containing protein [Verrucomicrobiota bacterium]
MNTNIITCPKCKAEIPLTDAMAHQVREQMEKEFAARQRKLVESIEVREKTVADQAKSVAEAQRTVERQVADQLADERKKLQAEAQAEAKQGLSVEMQDLRNQLEDRQNKLAESQNAELELRKQQRQLEERGKELELEVARKLDEERNKIADHARQQGADAERLKVADKDNLIKGLQDQIAQLQQRAEQGSMQLQGETLELDLEQQLRANFLFDVVAEIKKGQRGADVSQCVRLNNGTDCGDILWEAKRAKKWSADWPAKLKEDQREAKAALAAIVTTCPPEGLRGIGQVDGVWVCEPAFVVGLAAALRQGLISTAIQRVQQVNRADKMAMLYDHLCSVAFRQHIEAVVESFLGLKEQLDAEKRAFARQWKEREQQLEKAITHTAMLYGGVQGIAGREALPEIKTLQLEAGAPAENQ